MTTKDDTVTDTPSDPEAAFDEFLGVAELLTTPSLARLYTFVFRNGPVTVEEITSGLEMPRSTVYKYLGRLEEMGTLSRDGGRPTTVTADTIRVRLDADDGAVVVTPVLIDAIGRQGEDDDIRVFVDRQGVPKLAAALHYIHRIRSGELTRRTAAGKLGVHPVEGMVVFTALEAVVDEAASYDPSLDPAA